MQAFFSGGKNLIPNGFYYLLWSEKWGIISLKYILMSDILLPPSPEPNRRKLIFVGIISLIFIIIFGIIVYMSRSSGGQGAQGFKPKTKEVVIWTVGMKPEIFESLTKGYNEYV